MHKIPSFGPRLTGRLRIEAQTAKKARCQEKEEATKSYSMKT